MTYGLLISDESRLDIINAFSWYEIQKEGLGKDFEHCLDDAFNALIQNLKIGQVKYKGIRVFYIRRFPYGVYYLIDLNKIKILSVFHSSRDPINWKKRL